VKRPLYLTLTPLILGKLKNVVNLVGDDGWLEDATCGRKAAIGRTRLTLTPFILGKFKMSS
jgi:hypothetical protein